MRDHDANRDVAGPQQIFELRGVCDRRDDVYDLSLSEFRDELSRQVRVRLICDCRLQVAHVRVDRIAEQEYLDDRQSDDHAERQPVAAQLQDFLAHDGHQTSQRHHAARSCGVIVTATKTSSSVAGMSCTRACMSCARNARSTSRNGSSTVVEISTRNRMPS